MPHHVNVRHEAIGDLIAKILAADGCSDDEAHTVADHLVGANLAGHDSHGVIRTIRYHQWLQERDINGRTALATILDTGPLVQFDGQRGMGQWLAREATSAGMARARTHGVAVVAMRRAGHIGRLGHYAEQACAQGIASIQFCAVASSRLVAPFGAAERRMGTNPVAVGVPNADGDDFILDFATSFVAEGKALVAAQGGKALPADALVDGEGRLSSDPRVLYGDTVTTDAPDARAGAGALRTMGEHKGSGLALACELLAGALTGNGTNGPQEHPFGNGWLAIFVDPARLDDGFGFASEVENYIEAVRAGQPAAGNDRVRIPGDKERETRMARREHGLPLSPSVLDAILAIADALSIRAEREALLL